MVRSRQVGFLHPAFLQHCWVSEWGGDWEGGWNGLLNPHPKATGTTRGRKRFLWQNMKWKAESLTTSWEATAVPLWHHPELPALAR